MKQKTIKRVAVCVGLVSITFLPGALWADATSQGTANQRQPGNVDDLSWPMTRLLEPSLKWDRKPGTFRQALGIGPLDSLHPTGLHPMGVNYVRGVDLPGEWFVTVISTGATSSGVAANYDAILKGAGYSESVAIPEEQVVLGFYDPQGRGGGRLANNQLPYSVLGSYIKRKDSNIRLVVILSEANIAGPFPHPSGTRVNVFASDITPLEQILKKPQ